MKRGMFLLAVAFVIQGCAVETPTMTREEWLAVSSRTYENVTKDEALAATETILDLADGDDFNISHSQDGLYASRNWVVYLLIGGASGTDYWKVDAIEVAEGVRVSLQVNTQAQAIVPMATTGGDWTATTTGLAGSPVNGTAIYDVFWSRMDYLLGKSEEWMDCEEAKARVREGLTWGDNDPLCSPFSVKDNLPPELVPPRPPPRTTWN